VRDARLTDRVAHLAGNGVTTEWPAGHDVVLMSYVWSEVGGADIAVLARRAFDTFPSRGLILVHDFMVENADAQPPFAAWYLLGSIFDNLNAACLTPAFVEDALRQAGFQIDATEVMLPGITMLTRASRNERLRGRSLKPPAGRPRYVGTTLRGEWSHRQQATGTAAICAKRTTAIDVNRTHRSLADVEE
jgi:hypothetical protein